MEYLDKTGLAYFCGKIKEKINAKASVLDCYPVGAIYMSMSSTSPASLFGGTWEQLQGRFLLGAGTLYDDVADNNYSYNVGDTGGEVNHTLRMEETVQYDMWISDNSYSPGLSYNMSTSSGQAAYTHNQLNAAGHNNMPPYLVVYMWKRTK